MGADLYEYIPNLIYFDSNAWRTYDITGMEVNRTSIDPPCCAAHRTPESTVIAQEFTVMARNSVSHASHALRSCSMAFPVL